MEKTLVNIRKNFDAMPLVDEQLDINTGFYVDTILARTSSIFNSPLKELYNTFINNYSDFIQVLMGHNGCGKSTEINKLELDLKKEGFSVKKFDCKTETSINQVTVYDVLFLILQSLIEIADEKNISFSIDENKIIEKAIDYFKETEIIKTITEESGNSVEAGAGFNFSFPNIVSLFAKGKTGIKYNTAEIQTVKEKIKLNNADLFNCIDMLSNRIFQETQKRPIIIFEGLDKIGPSLALEIFRDGLISSEKIRTYCIFTFPISLTYDKNIGAIEHFFNKLIFPMIEVKHQDGTINEEGVAIIKKIINKRINHDFFEDGCIDLLIEKTGGSLRDILDVIRKSIDAAGFENSNVIKKEYVEYFLNYLKYNEYSRRIVTGEYEDLRNIHNNKTEIENKDKMLEFLRANIVLEYNGTRWHDCHPLIWDFIEENSKK